jgi:transposase
VIPNPCHLKRRLKKLKRLQRVVSRQQKGRKNRKKAVRKLAKLHRQIKNQRSNRLHQVTTRLAKTKSVLVIEDLRVSGMLKNHRLAAEEGVPQTLAQPVLDVWRQMEARITQGMSEAELLHILSNLS